MGKSTITFNSLASCPAKDKKIDFNIITKDEKKVSEFIVTLNQTYFIEDYTINNDTYNFYSEEAFHLQLALWVLAAAVIIMMTLYESAIIKKEVAIRSSLGEKPSAIFAKNTISDLLVFFIEFVLCLVALKNATNVFFSFKVSLIMFGFVVLCDALAYLPIIFIDIKKAFSSIKPVSLLSFSHGIKIFTTLITVIALTALLGVLSQLSDILKQQSFYDEHKDFNFVTMNFSDDYQFTQDSVSQDMLFYKLQKDCFDNGGVLLQCCISEYDGKGCLLFNRNTKDYLLREIPQLKGKIDDNTIYLIYPEGYTPQDLDIVRGLSTGIGLFFAHDYELKYVSYSGKSRLMAINDRDKGYADYYNNPFIIYSNFDESKSTLNAQTLNSLSGDISILYTYRIMFRINEQQFIEFAKKNGYDTENNPWKLFNVSSQYNMIKITTERLSKLLIFLLTIIILIEALQIYTVVKLEYTVHAKEFAIKKVLGYSLFDRMKKLYLTTLIIFFITVFAVLILNAFLDLINMSVFLVFSTILLVAELVTIALFTLRFEKTQTTKILKGGLL